MACLTRPRSRVDHRIPSSPPPRRPGPAVLTAHRRGWSPTGRSVWTYRRTPSAALGSVASRHSVSEGGGAVVRHPRPLGTDEPPALGVWSDPWPAQRVTAMSIILTVQAAPTAAPDALRIAVSRGRSRSPEATSRTGQEGNGVGARGVNDVYATTVQRRSVPAAAERHEHQTRHTISHHDRTLVRRAQRQSESPAEA